MKLLKVLGLVMLVVAIGRVLAVDGPEGKNKDWREQISDAAGIIVEYKEWNEEVAKAHDLFMSLVDKEWFAAMDKAKPQEFISAEQKTQLCELYVLVNPVVDKFSKKEKDSPWYSLAFKVREFLGDFDFAFDECETKTLAVKPSASVTTEPMAVTSVETPKEKEAATPVVIAEKEEVVIAPVPVKTETKEVVAAVTAAGLTDAKKAELKERVAELKFSLARMRKEKGAAIQRLIAKKEAELVEINKQLG